MNGINQFNPYPQQPLGSGSSPISPEILQQLLQAQQLSQNPTAASLGLQGPGQDALLSLNGTGPGPGGPKPPGGGKPPGGDTIKTLATQMEQQLQSGDKAGARQTAAQLIALKGQMPQPPGGGKKPAGTDPFEEAQKILSEGGDGSGAGEPPQPSAQQFAGNRFPGERQFQVNTPGQHRVRQAR